MLTALRPLPLPNFLTTFLRVHRFTFVKYICVAYPPDLGHCACDNFASPLLLFVALSIAVLTNILPSSLSLAELGDQCNLGTIHMYRSHSSVCMYPNFCPLTSRVFFAPGFTKKMNFTSWQRRKTTRKPLAGSPEIPKWKSRLGVPDSTVATVLTV